MCTGISNNLIMSYDSLTVGQRMDDCICISKKNIYGGELFCTQPFDITVLDCQYNTATHSDLVVEVGNTIEFGDLRTQINNEEACFSSIEDHLYLDCSTENPVKSSLPAVNLEVDVTIATDQSVSVTFISSPGGYLDACLCFGIWPNGITCSETFGLTHCNFVEEAVADLTIFVGMPTSHDFGDL
jgi:hypothetical protein